MPAEVVEKPVSVGNVPGEVSKGPSAVADVLGTSGRGLCRPAETRGPTPSKTIGLLHKIFEGHGEFLGWTPD